MGVALLFVLLPIARGRAAQRLRWPGRPRGMWTRERGEGDSSKRVFARQTRLVNATSSARRRRGSVDPPRGGGRRNCRDNTRRLEARGRGGRRIGRRRGRLG